MLLFKLIFGALPGLLNGVVGFLSKRADVDLQKHTVDVNGDVAVNVSQFHALVALAGMAKDSRKEDQSHWWTAWMVPIGFGVFMLHASAIVFDSLPLFGHHIGSWRIPSLPGAWTSVQQNIILTTLGIGGIGSLTVLAKKLFTK